MSHTCDGRDRACVSCAEIARRHDLVRAAMTVDDQLDDIKRARIWGELEDKLSAPAPRRARWPYAIGAAAFAAVVVIAMIARAPQHADLDDRHTVTIPADTTAMSRLGPHTRAALVGPAQLDLVGAAGEATTVRLRSGTLLADFEGGAGRALRIETGRAVIEVVGTLFAVEIRDGETCTSVAHGRVRVSTLAGVIHVADGEQYCTSGSLRPIASETRDALERHEAVITARAESASPSVASAPPPVASAPPPVGAAPSVAAPAVTLDPSATPESSATPEPTPAPEPPTARISPRRTSSDVPPPPPPRAPRVATTVEQARPPGAAIDMPPTPEPAPSSPPPSSSPPSPPPPTSPPSSSPASSSPPSSSPPPTSPPSSSPPPTSPIRSSPTPTAEELYATAEAALAARDAKAADRALATLLAAHPASPLVDQVLYERARIAYQQRSWARARHHLDRLAAIPHTRLAEPGRYLACRIAVETRDGEAASCLADYRRRFPRAPHDLDALALLVQLAHGAGGCARAASLVDELVRMYPRTTLAAAWRQRCPEAP